MHSVAARRYRRDIDGLRAIAVIAVMLFHFGVLDSGFLGVDVFFVISGYLITGILRAEQASGEYSVARFYLRRIRRIVPLALVVGTCALAVGALVMLPDDLENLAQSVIATNLFANNVLLDITTGNYWDVVNEFKPLQHTWSLGVEEQYYLLYPLLFLLPPRWLLPALGVLGAASLAAMFAPSLYRDAFYLIQYRFWELACGGIVALLSPGRVHVHRLQPALIVALLAVLCAGHLLPTPELRIIVTVLLTMGLLMSASEHCAVSRTLLENRAAVWIGLLSYSLYMWHQPVLAFMRYLFVQQAHSAALVAAAALILALSLLSHHFVERPFRDRRRVTTVVLLASLGALFVVSSLAATAIYLRGGVLRDVPELDLRANQGTRRLHAAYNDRVHQWDRDFDAAGDRIRVLVVGRSFARDWVNVLLESRHAARLDISYVALPTHPALQQRLDAADLVFAPRLAVDESRAVGITFDLARLQVVGTKNFGISNGVFYNVRGPHRCQQRAAVQPELLAIDQAGAMAWGERYIDLMKPVLDADGTVPVFTPDCKFISQDTRHFTRAGAAYYARLLDPRIDALLQAARTR